MVKSGDAGSSSVLVLVLSLFLALGAIFLALVLKVALVLYPKSLLSHAYRCEHLINAKPRVCAWVLLASLLKGVLH